MITYLTVSFNRGFDWFIKVLIMYCHMTTLMNDKNGRVCMKCPNCSFLIHIVIIKFADLALLLLFLFDLFDHF